jgi:hypothetical protein
MESETQLSEVTQVIVAVTGLGYVLAEKIAAECSDDLSGEIVSAYKEGFTSTEILALIGSRKIGQDVSE